MLQEPAHLSQFTIKLMKENGSAKIWFVQHLDLVFSETETCRPRPHLSCFVKRCLNQGATRTHVARTGQKYYLF